jgi:hypothetical protein
VASSRKLESEAIAAVGRDKVILVQNGVDTRHYRKLAHKFTQLPENLISFRKKYTNIVGYFGAIAPWLWYETIAELVKARPDLGFVFIGPNYYIGGNVDKLPKAENVLYLGPVDYRILPAYARQFDVCFIPFAPGEIAHTTSPLKLYEYFALKKPVVVTSEMLECVAFKEVFSGDSPATLSQAIDAALQIKDDPKFKSRLAQLADENDWEARALAMEMVLQGDDQPSNEMINKYSAAYMVKRPLRQFAKIVFDALPLDPRSKQKLKSTVRRALRGTLTRKLMPSASPGKESEWVIKANQAERIAIIPCGFEFDELVNQRPINAAKYFAEQGYFVVFVAWQWLPQDAMARGCGEVWPNVYQVPLFNFVSEVEMLRHHQEFSLFLVTFPAPLLVNLVSSLRSRGLAIVYDIMDEWEAFFQVDQASWFLKSAEDSLVLQSDYVCAVSPPLRDKFSLLRSDITIIGNGYTPEVIGVEHKGIAINRHVDEQIIGYFGHLTDSWFDWNLVFDLARKRPNTTFEIIGYGEPDWAAREAASLSNIRILGKIPPKELYCFTSRWAAGIIPFVEGVLAEAVDPIKIYEYLYFGLPTVVTGIRHIEDYPMTYFAKRENILGALDLALKHMGTPEELDSFLQQTTWKARFDTLVTQVQENPNMRFLYAS